MTSYVVGKVCGVFLRKYSNLNNVQVRNVKNKIIISNQNAPYSDITITINKLGFNIFYCSLYTLQGNSDWFIFKFGKDGMKKIIIY